VPMIEQICIPLAEIERRAAAHPPDYRAAVLACARQAGAKLCFDPADYLRIRAKFPAPPRAKPRGLGDLVALVAEPIARASDAVLGTHLVGCGGCAQRRAALNALVPDITKPL
jgi:hypothetical protein